MKDFNFEIDPERLASIRESYIALCDANVALKKARRRARIVRTTEKGLMLIGAVTVYKTVKRHKENEV